MKYKEAIRESQQLQLRTFQKQKSTVQWFVLCHGLALIPALNDLTSSNLDHYITQNKTLQQVTLKNDIVYYFVRNLEITFMLK